MSLAPDFESPKVTGEDVKKIREILGMSQDRLSKALDLSLSTIAQWEQNTRKISVENQDKLRRLFYSYITHEETKKLGNK